MVDQTAIKRSNSRGHLMDEIGTTGGRYTHTRDSGQAKCSNATSMLKKKWINFQIENDQVDLIIRTHG